jgi:hypothetical protein
LLPLVVHLCHAHFRPSSAAFSHSTDALVNRAYRILTLLGTSTLRQPSLSDLPKSESGACWAGV